MNLNQSLGDYVKGCNHISVLQRQVDADVILNRRTVCKTCAIAWAQEQSAKKIKHLEEGRDAALKKLGEVDTERLCTTQEAAARVIIDSISILQNECHVCWYRDGNHEAECPEK